MHLRYLLFLVTVSGESMWPDLVPGKTYFATSLRAPQKGRFAVVSTKNDGALVKRVERVEKGIVVLAGLVSWSSTFIVPLNDVLGVLLT